jgi:hypothetical protein
MAYNGNPDYERAGRIAYYLAIAGLAIAGAYAAFAPHAPPPANSKAFGCYTNPLAAPILLDRQGMAILQQDPLRFGYHLEDGKNGIVLTAEAPISADLVGQRYLFSIDRVGIGKFLNFITVKNGRSYGVFDPEQLDQFEMLATDGTDLAYRKGPDGACAPPQPSRSSSQAKS